MKIKEAIGKSRKGRKKVVALVRKKHPEIGSSRIRRIYSQSGLTLTKRLKRRRYNNPCHPASVPLKANEEWAIDFMHDSLVNGRAIRSLNIIDHFNRECKGIFIRHSIPAAHLIEFMNQAIEKYGKPKFIRTDNGPEFISREFKLWMDNNEIGWNKIQNGKPQQNCFIERFNRTMREEFLDAHLFFNIEQANELAATFLNEYNSERPHESLANLTPLEYAA